MTPDWLINRVKLMSVGEIVYRLRQSLFGRLEMYRLAKGWSPQPACAVTSGRLLFSKARFDAGRPREFASAAASLVTGKLSLFEYAELDVGWPINWHRDPLTGVNSPITEFGKFINYRDDARVGDIKVLWELGRQQFLVPVAAQYYFQREQTQLEAIEGVLNSWLQQNPYGYGVHWCSSLEVALRGISWCVTHQLLLAAGLPGGLFALDIDVPALKTQIYQHAAFIRSHLSLYSSANNHLIGELTGLHVLCSLFDFGKESEDWKMFAWRSLQDEADKQVYKDGVNKEQAIYYHCWVLEYLLINSLVATCDGRKVTDGYLELLTKMGQFVRDIAPMESEPPQIGDADDGVAIQFSSGKSSFSRDLIETVNVLSGKLRPDAAGLKAFCYNSFCHPGTPSGILPVEATVYPASYPDGGYAILGSPAFHVVFDCGALGYTSIAAHGHADMLSACLAIDGRWWLVDPGTFSYHSDHGWRDYFRGSRAHNVLSINGRDQSEIGGPFMWVKHARAHFSGVNSAAGVHMTSGWHDGYSGQGVPQVRRSLTVNAVTREMIVSDEVDCDRQVDVRLHYHFSPEVRCVEESVNGFLLEMPGTSHRVQIQFSSDLTLASYRGDAQSQLGWYSSGLGKKEPCLTICAIARVSRTASFKTSVTVVTGY